MTVINDLIEDWIQVRATFQRQIKTLETVQIHVETNIHNDKAAKDTIVRLKVLVTELNKLLKEHSRA